MADINYSNADVIDSRDIIERIEELESILTDAHAAETESGATDLDFDEWLDAMRAAASPASSHELNLEREEFEELRRLADECECYADWVHGETLIADEYFTKYIEELINDCYEMPKDVNSGKWPWRHMTMDYDAAAEEAKADYAEVGIFGRVFWIRNV